MQGLSKAQRGIAERILAGGKLFLNPATGFYSITEDGRTVKVDQRPVEAMLIAGVLRQESTGRCALVPDAEIENEALPQFSAGQRVRWGRVVRGALKGYIDATVVSATAKMVRIEAGRGHFHLVRPSALSHLN